MLLLSDLVAAHYGVGCGGVMDTVLSSNPLSLDLEHPIDISAFTGIDVSQDALIHIGEPNEKYV